MRTVFALLFVLGCNKSNKEAAPGAVRSESAPPVEPAQPNAASTNTPKINPALIPLVGTRAAKSDTKMQLKNVEQALVKFQTDFPEPCPKSIDELVQKGFLKTPIVDLWGERLLFKCPGTHENNTDTADIVSKGPDKVEGTADDIRSWDPN